MQCSITVFMTAWDTLSRQYLISFRNAYRFVKINNRNCNGAFYPLGCDIVSCQCSTYAQSDDFSHRTQRWDYIFWHPFAFHQPRVLLFVFHACTLEKRCGWGWTLLINLSRQSWPVTSCNDLSSIPAILQYKVQWFLQSMCNHYCSTLIYIKIMLT